MSSAPHLDMPQQLMLRAWSAQLRFGRRESRRSVGDEGRHALDEARRFERCSQR
jgi:hypothetical protein